MKRLNQSLTSVALVATLALVSCDQAKETAGETTEQIETAGDSAVESGKDVRTTALDAAKQASEAANENAAALNEEAEKAALELENVLQDAIGE